MKIEKIVIRNLTSIEGEQVIDFTEEPLRSAGLFAITGDTGSGKSTILDAICLALYDKAPRFENAADKLSLAERTQREDKAQRVAADDAAGILRRGQKQGGAVVTFSTSEGERYEAIWSIRIKRTGTYDRPERTLLRLAPQKERLTNHKEIQTRIEAVTGLDYHQFTKTVILAQNSFANFLRAKSGEKAVLLEKLTGTEIYGEISREIYERAAAAEAVVRDLDSRMQGILHDRLSEEILVEMRDEKQLLTTRETRLSEERAQVVAQRNWLEDYAQATAEVSGAEQKLHAANRALDEVRGDRLKLDRYDLLLPMQPLFQEIKMRRADIHRIKTEEAATTGALEASREAIYKLSAALDTARERTADAEKQETARIPAINRGHALTGEINATSEQLARSEEQYKIEEIALKNRTDALQAKQASLAAINRRLDALNLHEQTLAVHRQMFEKFDLIKDKLAMLRTETDRNMESHERSANLQSRRSELQAQCEKLEKERHDRQARLNALRSELHIHQEANRGRDFGGLQQRVSKSRSHLVTLRRAAVVWKHIAEGYATLSEGRAAVLRHQKDLERQAAEIEKAEIGLAATKEAYDRIHTTYTLSQTEDLVRLRRLLKEGTACPVCGATHHPYHTETERELGKLLNNLGLEYEAMVARLKSEEESLTRRKEAFAAGKASVEAEKRALSSLEKRQDADIEEWTTTDFPDKSLADCSQTVNRDARRMTIEMLIDSHLRTVNESEAELADYDLHQGQINLINESVSRMETEMEDSRASIERLKTEEHIAAASAEDLQRVIVQSDKACGELYADLSEMISLSGWFSEWKHNADGFRMRLGELYNDWVSTHGELERTCRNAELLNEEIKAAENAVEESGRNLDVTRGGRDNLRERLGTMKEEMCRLFGNAGPQEEARRLRETILKFRAAEQEAKALHQKEEGRLRELEGRKDNLVKTRLENNETLRTKQQELDLIILRFNGLHSPTRFAELEDVFSDESDRNILRRRLAALDEIRLIADRNLHERRERLLKLQATPGRPKETDDTARTALEERAAAIEGETKEIAERLSLLKSRLLSHDHCVKSAERLQQQIDAARLDATEWQRLNLLFGSSDGKKFRTLAQSYTFARLVRHANLHLRRLTARYELAHIPGTLSLEVIDRHMLDERRYTSSLSGGETFVVSLSLALALASVSSSSLTIGSLFIDEGFGNLDHRSLDLVMQALSNLEDVQGRKVGIISHTEQIRERISPQVRLKRLPGGNHSVIEVR